MKLLILVKDPINHHQPLGGGLGGGQPYPCGPPGGGPLGGG